MLELRLLGEPEVLRDGTAVPLPPSKKSRALLAYLAATGRPHSRERLCELLWDGPDDPRAQLRWSLTRIRPLVEPHLAATRDSIEWTGDAVVDVRRICVPATAQTEVLEACAAWFRGEFLEGLDLPDCFRFQQWCSGERERFRKLHIAILAELTERHGWSEAALPHARRRVVVDPFDEQAHASLIGLLAKLGDHQEALRQYEHTRRLFERELGTRPGPAIEEVRRAIGRTQAAPKTSPAADRRHDRFVGRSAELARIESATGPVLVLGEPGIGKSRLIDELRARSGGRTVYARAFAAEMIRPYGLWADALGSIPPERDRLRLFESVVSMLEGVSLIAVDDVQWINEASAALLHYVARNTAARIVLAARAGEIDDNPHALRLLRDLPLMRIELGPLSPAETCALVGDGDAAQRSGGNPLFALELSRSGATSGALSSVIASRLEQLDGTARELVPWAAAIGRQFDADLVGRASGMPAGEMLAALEKLERLAIVRASGERTYDFTHDLIRDAAYQLLSAPRRTLLHRHLADALRRTHDPDHALAGDILHHASLCGDAESAVTAAIDAGRRCLRMFAYSEAMSVVRRAVPMLDSIAPERRIESEMELMHVLVMARVPIAERIVYSGRIAELIGTANREGLHAAASLGAHLLACIHEEANNYSEAATATIESAEISRGTDPATMAFTLASSARCLLFLQRDVARAEMLVSQAQAIGTPNCELSLALGYLHAHHGRSEEAAPHLEQALELAARKQDHWREWLALHRLVTLALEENDPQLALRHCVRLHLVTEKMSGGSEGVRSRVLEKVARFAAGEAVDIEAAIAELRAVDSKSDLAWVLTVLAQVESDRERIRAWATEALHAAEAVGRSSEAVIARCLLGLDPKVTPDVNARARRLVKEYRHGRSRSRAVVS